MATATLVQRAVAAARRALFKALLVIYETLGEGALAFAAEASPIASEAMEDFDPAVRQVRLLSLRVYMENYTYRKPCSRKMLADRGAYDARARRYQRTWAR